MSARQLDQQIQSMAVALNTLQQQFARTELGCEESTPYSALLHSAPRSWSELSASQQKYELITNIREFPASLHPNHKSC